MNYFKTAILLAALTALFMLIGFLIGGQIGMIIAFGVAFLMNIFSYWNSDQVVLRMNNATDRLGAEICGQPLWLASALDRMQEVAQNTPNQAAERNPAAAHMFIINPLTGQSMDKLFSTHPRTENRIARLVALAEKWGTYDTPTDQPDTATRRQMTPHPAGPPTDDPWSRNTKNDTRGRGGNNSW